MNLFRDLMSFNQILTKSDQTLTIYVKNHQIHLENFQECNFLKIKKTTSKTTQDLDAGKNVDASRFWTGKPKSCNIHIYNFHVLELLNLVFPFFLFFLGELIN